MTVHPRRLAPALCLLAPLAIGATVDAADLQVPGSFPTINAAVAASADDDVIVIAPGAYAETVILSNRDLTFRSSTGDPDDVLITSTGNQVFRILGSSTVTLSQLTFSSSGSSAVLVTGDATIEKCIFSECEAPSFGGGVQVSSGGFAEIRDSLFRECTAGVYGAAIYVTGDATATVNNTRFEDNQSQSGVVFCFSGFVGIDRSWFEGNVTDFGVVGTNGGANMNVADSVLIGNDCDAPVFAGGTVKVTNVTIDRNDSQSAGLGIGAGNLVVTNSIARDPAGLPPVLAGTILTAEYSNIEGGPSGPGMIDADPLYVGSGLSLDAGSPGIDAAAGSAASSTDFNGDPRAVDDPNIPNTGSGATPFVDMGAFERVSRIRYVDANATAGTGLSWGSPYRDLQDALDDALANPADVREIWLANGVYKPDRGTGIRGMSFSMRGALDILGGFAGGETRRSETDFPFNQTILSGEINGPSIADNSYNVVQAVNVNASGSLRGVIIERGYANGPETFDARGGGLLVRGGGPRFDQIWIRQCNANTMGHAIMSEDSDASFRRLRANRNGQSLPGRGAIAVRSGDTFFSQVLLHGNRTGTGACFDFGDGAVAQVHLATVADNTSDIWVAGIGAFGSVVDLTNSIVDGNVALNPFVGQPPLQDNVFNVTARWTTIGGQEAPNELFGTNGFPPGFVDRDGADNVPGNADDNFRLAPGSCLIDSGNNDLIPAGSPVDIVGVDRRIDDPGTADTGVGTGSLVDRGAYEFDGVSCQGDLDGDGQVAFNDLLTLLAGFGPCNGCPGDLNCDGEIAFGDLLSLLAAFGPCPHG